MVDKNGGIADKAIYDLIRTHHQIFDERLAHDGFNPQRKETSRATFSTGV